MGVLEEWELLLADSRALQQLGGVPRFPAVARNLAFVVGAAFSGISYAFALLMRREETVIAVANFVGLPLIYGFFAVDATFRAVGLD